VWGNRVSPRPRPAGGWGNPVSPSPHPVGGLRPSKNYFHPVDVRRSRMDGCGKRRGFLRIVPLSGYQALRALRALRCVASGRHRLFVLQIPRCARPWAGRRCPRPAIAPPCSLSPAPLTRIRAWCGSKTPTSSSPSVLAPRSRRSPGSASRCGSRQPAGDLRARAGPGSAIMGLFL